MLVYQILASMSQHLKISEIDYLFRYSRRLRKRRQKAPKATARRCIFICSTCSSLLCPTHLHSFRKQSTSRCRKLIYHCQNLNSKNTSNHKRKQLIRYLLIKLTKRWNRKKAISLKISNKLNCNTIKFNPRLENYCKAFTCLKKNKKTQTDSESLFKSCLSYRTSTTHLKLNGVSPN